MLSVCLGSCCADQHVVIRVDDIAIDRFTCPVSTYLGIQRSYHTLGLMLTNLDAWKTSLDNTQEYRRTEATQFRLFLGIAGLLIYAHTENYNTAELTLFHTTHPLVANELLPYDTVKLQASAKVSRAYCT